MYVKCICKRVRVKSENNLLLCWNGQRREPTINKTIIYIDGQLTRGIRTIALILV